MKTSIILAQAFASAVLALPVPTTDGVDYSKIDYSHIDWKNLLDWTKLDYSHVDYSQIDWNKVDYSKVDYGKVDWNKVDYSKVDWSKVPYEHQPAEKHDDQEDEEDKHPSSKGSPFDFTSYYHVIATPDQVVNASNISTGGLEGATGYYDFAINSKLDLICYYIELKGFRGDYQSPARTATHIHQADKGKNGPPRIAFPNPVAIGQDDIRRSVGCLTGPFVTGLNNTAGVDNGAGFKVSQIEENPANFFADVHSSLAVPGAVRGQLA